MRHIPETLLMKLGGREIFQLCIVVAVAAALTLLLRSQRPAGQDVSKNDLALSIRNDRSSPTEENTAADLTLIVFTDYRCPACRAAHPEMRKAIAHDGKVRVVYKDWPIFGVASERAAKIAIASSFQEIYPAVHDQLMRGPAGSEGALRAAVERQGGDWGRLQRDLTDNQEQIIAQLARNRRQAFELRLAGTPGYLIGPILVRGALSEREFIRAFRDARSGN